ncbi:MucBP domain-containing protein [Levilactobacillus parabrevis]|uniref:MucBP domain-containing protein n=1 Tax=Levilactobacillus parabrevis TaxID=357278 RepID=UPI0021A48833|nr:MucBP domain-containing protein [Levilactobacillus parabrevis]MCT4486902.1 LPXTG cell wall anchor domain-containing protein [Levilactobacillus parabrevis]MCT4489477.1 LPXTG cell wall anchor domain-containing protein [Levilactobacillus parabrevis]
MNQHMQTKTHYKMYKKGKTWVTAGIVSGTLLFALSGVTAQADEQGATREMLESNVKMKAPTVLNQEVASTTTAKNSENQKGQQAPAVIEESGVSTPIVGEQVAEPILAGDAASSGGKMAHKEKVDTTAQTLQAATTTEAPVRTELRTSDKLPKLARDKSDVTKAKTPKATKDTGTIDQWMPNKTLQKLVLIHLKKLDNSKEWNSVADITQEDMQLLEKFYALGNDGYDTYIDGKTEFSLEGMQFATNLTVIMMGATRDKEPGAFYGDIVDVKPLANLQKLQLVSLDYNRIEDVTPLANLKNVTDMRLEFNHIRDFSPLKGKNYETFTSMGQLIMLDPVMINSKDRTGHLQIQCFDINGDVKPLSTKVRTAVPVFNSPSSGATYRLYYTGGTGTPDGQGGLNFTDIHDQKPGVKDPPNDWTSIDVLPDKYYLMGSSISDKGIFDFVVIQPYAISTPAASVTVHFQDEAGKSIADDEVLPERLIGEDYTTTAKEIEGYTLQKIPANATGKYGEKPTDVIYVYAKKSNPVKPPLVTPPTEPTTPPTVPPTEPAKQTTVTVHHQTAAGQQVAADQVLTGKSGENYTTQPATPAGYKLVVTPANASGKFGDSDTTVTYIYEAVESGTDGDGWTTGQPAPTAPGDGDTDTGDTVISGGGSGDLVYPENDVIDQGGLGNLVGSQADPQPTPNPITGSISPLSTASPASGSDDTVSELPQTGERQTSALWGIALLTTLYSLLGIKRKMK